MYRKYNFWSWNKNVIYSVSGAIFCVFWMWFSVVLKVWFSGFWRFDFHGFFGVWFSGIFEVWFFWLFKGNSDKSKYIFLPKMLFILLKVSDFFLLKTRCNFIVNGTYNFSHFFHNLFDHEKIQFYFKVQVYFAFSLEL